MSGRVSLERLGERPWKGILWLVLEEAGVVFDGDLVRVPYRGREGDVHAWRVLAPSGRCWWEPTGVELLPFGLETLPTGQSAERAALILAEGESDALALREAFAGVGPGSAVSGYYVLGLPGAGTWRPEWAGYFEAISLVYVAGDGDPAGRRMIDAVCRDVHWARPVWLVEGEDARSILQAHGPRALDVLLDRADELAKVCVALFMARDYEHFISLMSGTGRPARAA